MPQNHFLFCKLVSVYVILPGQRLVPYGSHIAMNDHWDGHFTSLIPLHQLKICCFQTGFSNNVHMSMCFAHKCEWISHFRLHNDKNQQFLFMLKSIKPQSSKKKSRQVFLGLWFGLKCSDKNSQLPLKRKFHASEACFNLIHTLIQLIETYFFCCHFLFK